MEIGSQAAVVTLTAYLLLVGTIALIAAVHPDHRRRADARAVLDLLLRFRRKR